MSGGRPIELVDAGTRKELDLEVVVALEDMREPGSDAGLASPCCPTASRWRRATRRRHASIWPSIYPALLELVQQHRSTIVFVNNRRLAERLALRLNELADATIARAHHGSLAREQRVEIEELLKAGQIPCLVATSSLELGIDMGAVDLVIQVESPKSVARGLQRVGRAGPRPRRRLEGAYLPEVPRRPARVRRRREGDAGGRDRGDADPPQPARRARAADRRDLRRRGDLGRRPARPRPRRLPVRRPRARPARERARHARRAATRRTSSPSCGPRIVWDRTAGVVRGREGARRLAVTNAGTIPDRGLFGVFQVDGGGRVGELDEEMVYEARQGQTFMLGASTWRIEEITRDRVLVSPAPGVPGAVPFWKGEGVGRPFELGEKIGRASREIVALSDAKALERLGGDYHLDRSPRRTSLTYLRDQAEANGGVVPSDRTIVVERFRDEIGDWRLCILTPFGARVHAPWAMALGARLRDTLGLEVQSIWSDDGRTASARGGRASADRRPAPLRPTRSRSSSSRKWDRRRSSARASARTPLARS